MKAKVYTKNDLRLYLQESNKTIREIFYFDMIDYKINAFEEGLFCGGVLLQSIDLSGNQIDMIDMSMFKCEHVPNKCLGLLREVDLTRNSIARIWPNGFIGLGVGLKKLWLSSNKIKKIEATTFEPINQLEELYLRSNEIKLVKIDYFKELTKLQILDLSFNKIKEIEKDSFKDLKELKEISLQYNELEQIDSELFRGLENLETIYLHYNKFKNNLENKLQLYLENKVKKFILCSNKDWVENNLKFIRNLVII
jgi:Leucine-rich repeat (LRR) protein